MDGVTLKNVNDAKFTVNVLSEDDDKIHVFGVLQLIWKHQLVYQKLS